MLQLITTYSGRPLGKTDGCTMLVSYIDWGHHRVQPLMAQEEGRRSRAGRCNNPFTCPRMLLLLLLLLLLLSLLLLLLSLLLLLLVLLASYHDSSGYVA